MILLGVASEVKHLVGEKRGEWLYLSRANETAADTYLPANIQRHELVETRLTAWRLKIAAFKRIFACRNTLEPLP